MGIDQRGIDDLLDEIERARAAQFAAARAAEAAQRTWRHVARSAADCGLGLEAIAHLLGISPAHVLDLLDP